MTHGVKIQTEPTTLHAAKGHVERLRETSLCSIFLRDAHRAEYRSWVSLNFLDRDTIGQNSNGPLPNYLRVRVLSWIAAVLFTLSCEGFTLSFEGFTLSLPKGCRL